MPTKVKLRGLLGALAVSTTLSAAQAASPKAATVERHNIFVAPIAVVAAEQSSNWFGYNQGTLEQESLGHGPMMFHAVTGDWNVPAVRRHGARRGGQYSATWAGIGGGCVDTACTVTDNTLIQAGTEQDVINGKPQYSAWWEVIPAPSVTINGMTIGPGDHVHVDIHETIAGSEVWSLSLSDITRNESFTQTVAYSSNYATAEWVSETPLIVGTSAGFAALPRLSKVIFDNASTNGGPAGLVTDEEIRLVNANTGRVYSTPSGPDSDANGFTNCAWIRSCQAVSS